MTSKAWTTRRLKKWPNGSGRSWNLNVPVSARSSCTKHRQRAAYIAANSKERRYGQLSFPELTTRWRNASFCYRAWDAGCREVRPPFSCYRGTLRAPDEWRDQRRDVLLSFPKRGHFNLKRV